jgi:methionyl-tRNA synthetase
MEWFQECCCYSKDQVLANLQFRFHKKYMLVTTPIFYANAKPHIGHLYSLVLADAIHRFRQLSGQPSTLQTGTDEHGLKISNLAVQLGLTQQQLVDSNAMHFQQLLVQFNIQARFIRTTNPAHAQLVHNVWNRLLGKNLIYKSTYSGFYCPRQESFVVSKPVHGLDIVNEENYLLRIEPFRDQVLKWLGSDYSIVPASHKNWVLNNLHMADVSISRPSSRLKWGIPVPNDPSQTIYVWFDALCNYLTLNETQRTHIIGKDILKLKNIN